MRLLGGLLLCALFAPAQADITGIARYTIAPTPSNVIWYRYADGDDGTAALGFTWQTIQCQRVPEGTPYSVNLRALYLTEPGSPAADLALFTGSSLPSGWSVTTDGLSYSGTGTGLTQVVMNAARGGVNIQSNEFCVEAQPVASADTTAPLVPKYVTVSNGTGQYTLTIDPSPDVFEADGDPGSGTAEVDIVHSVDGTTTVAAQPGLSVQTVARNIGSFTPTPTVTQTGADWTFEGVAGDIDGADDLVPLAGAEFSGTGIASVFVDSITNTANFAKCGIQVRNSDSLGSRWLSAYAMKSAAGALQIQIRSRAQDNGTASNLVTSIAVSALPVGLRVQETATNVFEVRYSLDSGLTWPVAISGHALAMASSVKSWNMIATASTGSGGATMDCGLSQWSLNNLPRVSYTINSVSSGTVQLLARDADDNESALTASFAVAPEAPADTTPPSTPANPACTASGQTTINCSADAATDASGIRGYIWACSATSGSGFSDAAEQSSIAYALTGLSASTTRYCKVKAVDSAGNIGSYSAEASATTDADAPGDFTAPTISSVVALGQTSLRITHSAVAGADHYLLREAAVVGGPYTVLTQFDHTGLSVDRTGLSTGQTRCYQVAATNSDESTIGPWTATGVCGTTDNPTSGTAKKWHPGHYMQASLGDSETSKQSLRFGWYNQIASNTDLEGVMLRVKWGQLENTEGNYTLSWLRTELNYLKNLAVPKRLFLRLHERAYGNGPGSCTDSDMFPTYLRNSTGCAITNRGNLAKIWDTYVTDRLIALNEALAAEFDDDPYFEGIMLIRETATNGEVQSGQGYSEAAYFTQLKRYALEASQAWVKSNVIHSVNWVGQANVNSLIAYNASIGVGQGAPDVLPDGLAVHRPLAYNTIQGCTKSGSPLAACNGDGGGHDYRNDEIAVFYSVENTQLGGSLCPTCLPEDIQTYAEEYLDAKLLGWSRNTSTGSTAQQWPAILTWIASNPITNTTCPSVYTQGCDTN